MRGSIGQLLVAQGVIDAGGLSDALARQSGRHPVASELYALGYATERQLCAALSMQTGWPGIVLDESTIRLQVIEHVSIEWARIFSALVVFEDERSIVVAAARPEDAIVPARELGAARGKNVELRIALDVTLARTIRQAFRLWRAGDELLVGPEADGRPHLAVVHPGGSGQEELAQRALAEEAARSIEDVEELPSEDGLASVTLTGDWLVTTSTDEHEHAPEATAIITADLDRVRGGVDRQAASEGTARIRALVVDPDPAGRIQLVSALEKVGWECQAASTGKQAVELMAHLFFDLVFADIAAPEIDGLQLCRAIKKSKRMARTKVIVTTSVIDSGQVPEDVLQRHAADGYLEKPLDPRRLHRLIRDLSPDERADHEAVLADAIARYHTGDIDGAIERLRAALVTDPSSSKLHFMLANMLQRASRWGEAVDEYEATVELQPLYFPALTRLAYLYFRQGLHARAVETWRRALPVCEDPALRQNIELFMRKLVADMSKSDAG